MERVDFDQLWNEHLKAAGGLYLAVLCQQCKSTAFTCACSKAAWILKEKDRMFPGSVKAPHICHWCDKGTFDSWMRRDDKAGGEYFPVCRNCL